MSSSGRRERRHRSNSLQHERLSGQHVIGAALAARRRRFHRMLIRQGEVRDDVRALVDLALSMGIPIESMDGRALADLAETDDVGFQGLVLEAGPLPVLDRPESLFGPESGSIERTARWLVALDGVEDPRNLGAIARVAESAGAVGLLVTDRRSPPLGPVATRASAGALEWLPVCRVPNLSRALDALKKVGVWVVAADTDANDTLFSLPDRLLSGDLVVVLGAEGRGLRPSIRDQVDHPVRIPMRGRTESLNVSTAAAVILFEMVRRSERVGREAVST
jgi:23S rRNA (guanosine2251-2'-O)-methyltransferase